MRDRNWVNNIITCIHPRHCDSISSAKLTHECIGLSHFLQVVIFLWLLFLKSYKFGLFSKIPSFCCREAVLGEAGCGRRSENRRTPSTRKSWEINENYHRNWYQHCWQLCSIEECTQDSDMLAEARTNNAATQQFVEDTVTTSKPQLHRGVPQMMCFPVLLPK